MNEEFERRWERKVEFLLNQQAKFDAGMEELKAAQARTEESLNRTNETVKHIAGLMHEGFSVVNNLFQETAADIRELKESQKLTDKKLQDLIVTVDRHIKEGHKGRNGAQN